MTTLEKAIETYGKDMQLNVAIEEFSELIKEICKHKRGRDNREAIIEEMADCYIMLKQLEIIFDIDTEDIRHIINNKIDRLEKRLEEQNSQEKQEYEATKEWWFTGGHFADCKQCELRKEGCYKNCPYGYKKRSANG